MKQGTWVLYHSSDVAPLAGLVKQTFSQYKHGQKKILPFTYIIKDLRKDEKNDSAQHKGKVLEHAFIFTLPQSLYYTKQIYGGQDGAIRF